jgi:putative ABC transport system permease protein
VPEWLNSLRLRVRAVVRRRQLEQDLQDEMAFHLAMRERQLETSGARESAVGARRRFGNVTRIREDLRDTWALAPGLSALLRDFRYAARTLRRSPAFTLVIVLTLGLGIGANTAFFTVVNAALIRPLGYTATDRLVLAHESFPKAGVPPLEFCALDFDDFRDAQQSFESVAAYRTMPFELSGGTSPERLSGAKVSAGLFHTLGVEPIAGRTFLAAEDHPGVNVAILSSGLWQRRFGANPSIVGQTIQLDRQPYTVIGIMPAGFVFPRRGTQFNGEPADVWVPIAFTDGERAAMLGNSVVARLKPGVSLQAARAELDVLSERIAANYPSGVINAGFSPKLIASPLREEISGRFETPLLMLLGAVGLVLLVACANIANLILSRVTGRAREFAVRTALGAGRGRLVQLLLCESLVLSASGGVLGVLIAYWAVRAAPAVLSKTIPGLQELSLDVRVLAFTVAVCVVTAILFALVPLPMLDRRSPGDSLRDDGRTTSGFRQLHVQRGFVVVTVSLACVLLVGAGLFIRSFTALLATDAGFRPGQVLTASMTLPRTFYSTAVSVRSFHDSLTRNLQALPGVRSVTVATDLPLKTYDLRAFTPEGAGVSDGARPMTHLSQVQGPYFETLGIVLKRGRFFTADEYSTDRSVVIVNDKLASRFWPDQDAIGKRLRWGGAGSQYPWLTVVGVVGTVADGPLGTEPGVHAYEPFRQLPDFFLEDGNQFGRDLKVAVLADGAPRALAALVRQEIARLDRELAIESLEPMDDQVRDSSAPQRVSTVLVGAFAAIALLLASVGLYGLLAYTTARRGKEIAIRMALGAERAAVVRMVVGQGARLVAIGLAAGLLTSLILSRVVASLLYRTNALDPVTFALVPAVLAAAGFLACALPAWRAGRVEPATALRADY